MMYACLHVPEAVPLGAAEALLQLAYDFSPEVESAADDTVLFAATPLRRLLGSPAQIAAELSSRGYERKLKPQLALAADPDTAILLARHFPGVTIVEPGEEALRLAALPLSSLFAHDRSLDPAYLEILKQWGLKTCEDLSALPERGLIERIGVAGLSLRQLALGCRQRPLRISKHEAAYQSEIELDHEIEQLEPLLFLFSRELQGLCTRLRSQSQAGRILQVELRFNRKRGYQCSLEFPVPLSDHGMMLKLLQLHLERHGPSGPVQGFTLRIEPTAARRVQGGLFLPPTPQPDKLQITLARIAGLVGKDNVGAPQLLDTYRPDAFRLILPELQNSVSLSHDPRRYALRLSLRLFRPAPEAQVYVVNAIPRTVKASRVNGCVLEWSGPWKTSGEWWITRSWNREEWDVFLDDGALYRIHYDLVKRIWQVDGIYD